MHGALLKNALCNRLHVDCVCGIHYMILIIHNAHTCTDEGGADQTSLAREEEVSM